MLPNIGLDIKKQRKTKSYGKKCRWYLFITFLYRSNVKNYKKNIIIIILWDMTFIIIYIFIWLSYLYRAKVVSKCAILAGAPRSTVWERKRIRVIMYISFRILIISSIYLFYINVTLSKICMSSHYYTISYSC